MDIVSHYLETDEGKQSRCRLTRPWRDELNTFW